MSRTSHLRVPPLLAWMMALALTGCFGTSRPSRFYTLEPLQVREGPGSPTPEVTLAVGPVELPDYVDRPQIVTCSGNNELFISEFERWGGSLEKQISGSLVATLGDRLASRRIAVVPWRSAVLSSGTPDRVTVSVSRFDGVPGHSVVLQARWELRTQSGGNGRVARLEGGVGDGADRRPRVRRARRGDAEGAGPSGRADGRQRGGGKAGGKGALRTGRG